MRSAALILVGALALAACDRPVPIEPLVTCDAAAAAPVEPEPIGPVLTPEQRLAVDVAVVTVLGPDLGAALIRWTDVEYPAWGRRQAARVEATAGWCASLGGGG